MDQSIVEAFRKQAAIVRKNSFAVEVDRRTVQNSTMPVVRLEVAVVDRTSLMKGLARMTVIDSAEA